MIQKLTLLELNKSIQEKINFGFPDSLWVIAEISELKVNRNGHCYLELIEKDAVTDNIIAKSRATIWAFTFRMLKPYFENITRQQLVPGLKVLVQASVEFHELYGFSLNINDIDPNYTLGDLAQKRTEILRQLEEDGIINMNKELSFPTVPQKIAIISSETAAGYQDFIGQLENNNYGYKFYFKLFPSIMQGLQAEESIINSLEKIYHYENFFDLVVIIRGGGSQADLNCFNNYLLALNVAQFPIPVLTGIGHDKDESIVDVVAHKKLKTPTAVAEYIIEKTAEYEDTINYLKDNILDLANEYLENQKYSLSEFGLALKPIIIRKLEKQNYSLTALTEKLKSELKQLYQNKKIALSYLGNSVEKKSINSIYNYKRKFNLYKENLNHKTALFILNQKSILNNLDNKNLLLDPNNILKRGYSITYINGEKVKDIKKIKENDEVITKLFNGFIRSTVKEKMKKGKC